MIGSLLQRWIWQDRQRCARTLLAFAETEADGGRDLARAAELTRDPLLRRLYLRHAADEFRHAQLFLTRGLDLLDRSQAVAPRTAPSFTPGERGLDDVKVDGAGDAALLAFLHLSEKAAAAQFEHYRTAVGQDAGTAALFSTILSDETFHMKYTVAQLTRVAPHHHGWFLWKARAGRIWHAYLRFAVALAGAIGTVVLTLEYFLLLGPFALIARSRARQETTGWVAISRRRDSIQREY